MSTLPRSIKGKEEQLKGEYQKVAGHNTEQYHNIKHVNKLEQADLQAQVNKHEDNRKYLRPGKTFGVGGETKGF